MHSHHLTATHTHTHFPCGFLLPKQLWTRVLLSCSKSTYDFLLQRIISTNIVINRGYFWCHHQTAPTSDVEAQVGSWELTQGEIIHHNMSGYPQTAYYLHSEVLKCFKPCITHSKEASETRQIISKVTLTHFCVLQRWRVACSLTWCAHSLRLLQQDTLCNVSLTSNLPSSRQILQNIRCLLRWSMRSCFRQRKKSMDVYSSYFAFRHRHYFLDPWPMRPLCPTSWFHPRPPPWKYINTNTSYVLGTLWSCKS